MASDQPLKTDIAVTRERLAATIDQIVDRTNPKNVARRQVSGFVGFFVDENGGPRTDNILKVAAGVAGFLVVVGVIRKVAS